MDIVWPRHLLIVIGKWLSKYVTLRLPAEYLPSFCIALYVDFLLTHTFLKYKQI